MIKNLETNFNTKQRNYINTWRINNVYLNDQWSLKKSGEINKFLESKENESQLIQTCGITQRPL
jgi:hypothetical protein